MLTRRKAHFLAIPFLAAPAVTFRIDDAGARATTAFIVQHALLHRLCIQLDWVGANFPTTGLTPRNAGIFDHLAARCQDFEACRCSKASADLSAPSGVTPSKRLQCHRLDASALSGTAKGLKACGANRLSRFACSDQGFARVELRGGFGHALAHGPGHLGDRRARQPDGGPPHDLHLAGSQAPGGSAIDDSTHTNGNEGLSATAHSSSADFQLCRRDSSNPREPALWNRNQAPLPGRCLLSPR